MVGLFSCSDDDGATATGKASISMTDAAVDAENVTGVFLSVSEVQAISSTETRTVATFDDARVFNLMDYQNGEVYTLGEGDLEAGTYEEIRLIISGTADSYIEFDDGTTDPLEIPSGTSSGYKVKGAFEVAANTTTALVADVDLRKALVLTGEGTYKLRPTGRLLEIEGTGTIQGSIQGAIDPSEQVVVYAYQKGTFESSEENEPAEGSSRYENSVNSAIVAEDGSYTLAFMEAGEYELIVASYSNLDEDEDLEFMGRLNAEILISGILSESIEVESNTTVQATIQLL